MLDSPHFKAYSLLLAIIICGLATTAVTATKVVHLGVDFPCATIVFSIFSYPLLDCICELWGKKIAQQTLLLALGCQALIVILLQASIALPHAAYWHYQHEYELIFSASSRVVLASLAAFFISQLMDIIIYLKIKQLTNGRFLWLRTNVSTFIGQILDSIIFVFIVFGANYPRLEILSGAIVIKLIVSILMTPIVYLIVLLIDSYLNHSSLAFRSIEN